jgi:methionyl-tRNA formyltransferase
MKLVFAGTPEFAVPTLRALVDGGHIVSLVLTQPDRPAGRGMKLQPSPVKRAALQSGLSVAQPTTLRDPAIQQQIAALAPEAMVVVAYGLILPQAILSLPAHGCINVHASLLPRWRGAAPIHRALLAGDEVTGVSIMAMDAGLDTGPVFLVRKTPIAPTDTTGALHDRLASLGAEALLVALDRLAGGDLVATPQPSDGVSYATKIAKDEARIDWQQPAAAIDRQIRAFDPYPGATTTLGGEPYKFWACTPAASAPDQGRPGELLAVEGDRLAVACGEGALWITSLQRAGGKRLATRDFLAGTPLAAGAVFA